jgi:leucyl/phenylalanyl-tRNA--protein transferase
VPIVEFPDRRRTSKEGLLAVGGDLHPESLVLAYRQGIFPWPIEGMPLPWFCPPRRAILERRALHIPRSLRGTRNRGAYRLSIDQDFAAVIEACATTPRPDPDTGELAGTWITDEMKAAYLDLSRLGLAHSVEAWEGEALVGGLYGVSIDGAFSAESMFHTRPDASKLALVHLVETLAERGLPWIDVQVMSPHVKRLGAREIPRDDFLSLLERTQARKLELFPAR